MKKGFTLVELLAVIVVISVIASLVLTNINKETGKLKTISNEKYEKIILSSAKSYFYSDEGLKQDVKNGDNMAISYKTLKDNNYLDDELVNIKTYKKIDVESSCVCVSYQNYKYIFNIQQPCNCNN